MHIPLQHCAFAVQTPAGGVHVSRHTPVQGPKQLQRPEQHGVKGNVQAAPLGVQPGGPHTPALLQASWQQSVALVHAAPF
jgi:hypothetical protein